jgi:ankyrin repeat protein
MRPEGPEGPEGRRPWRAGGKAPGEQTLWQRMKTATAELFSRKPPPPARNLQGEAGVIGPADLEEREPLPGAVSIFARDEQGRNSLHRAVIEGDRAQAEKIIALAGEESERLMKPDNDGKTPYHHAAQVEDPKAAQEIMRDLLASYDRQNVHLQDKDKKNPLHYAVAKGDRSLVSELTSVGYNCKPFMKPDSNGKTPYHYAAQVKDPKAAQEIMRDLLASGEGHNVASPDSKGRNPLHYAAEQNPAMVAQLLKASDRASLMKPDKEGRTPLHLAVGGGNIDAALVLSERNSDYWEAADKQGRTPLDGLTHPDDFNKVCDSLLKSPVHYAIRFNRPDVATIIETSDPEKLNTADLDMAIDRGNADAVVSFLKCYPRANPMLEKDDNGVPRLHRVILTGNTDLVRKVFEFYKQDPFILMTSDREDNANPLHRAASVSREMCQVIIEALARSSTPNRGRRLRNLLEQKDTGWEAASGEHLAPDGYAKNSDVRSYLDRIREGRG